MASAAAPAVAPEPFTTPAPGRRATPAAAVSVAQPPASAAAPVVLDVRDVHTYFYTYDGVVRALDGVSFKLRRGETLGLVGETGCGKSVTAFTITRLVAEPPGRVVSGRVLFRGANLLWGIEREATYRPVPGTKRVQVRRRFRRIKADLQRMTAVRGSGISMVFQEPSQAMNPVFSVADQLGEVLYLHRGVEIVDVLLAADAPDLEWIEAVRGYDGAVGGHYPAGVKAAAHRLAELARVPVIEEELAGEPGAAPGPRGSAADQERRARVRRLLQHRWEAALEELAATPAGAGQAARAQARKVAELARLPSLESALFSVVSSAPAGGRSPLPVLRHQLGRLRLSGVQRAYLRQERRRLSLERELRQTFLQELREEKPFRAQRRKLGSARMANQLTRSPYRLWGLRRRVDRPVRDELFWQAVDQLERVQIANPTTVARGYPHELSGGMIQRVMIAMALSTNPHVLLADEPTTALDVTIQAQILDLMRALKERVGTAIVLITHDLAVIAEVTDRVCVMYAGQIVEIAPVRRLFDSPLHPYTQGLLASIPRLDRPEKDLRSIPGSVPDLIDPPNGCRFHPRCPHAMPVCASSRPPMTEEGGRHQVACFLYHGPAAQE